MHGFRKRTKNHAGLGEAVLEGGGHRDAVKHGIDGDARESRAFVQRHAELFVCGEQLGVDVGETLWPIGVRLGRRVIRNGLVVDRHMMHACPLGFAHLEPAIKRLEAPIRQELRFAFLAGNGAYDIVIQSRRQAVGFDIGNEAVSIGLRDRLIDGIGCTHTRKPDGRRSSGCALCSRPASCARLTS